MSRRSFIREKIEDPISDPPSPPLPHQTKHPYDDALSAYILNLEISHRDGSDGRDSGPRRFGSGRFQLGFRSVVS